MAPTIDLVGEPPDYEGVAQALEVVGSMVERAKALEALAENHKVLQRAYPAEHRRAEDLQRRVDSMEQTIRAQAPRIQARFARLISQRDQDQLCIAEYRDALAVQRDYSREVEESRFVISALSTRRR